MIKDIYIIFIYIELDIRFPYQPYLCRVSGGAGESDALRGGEHEEVGHHWPGARGHPLHCPSHRLLGSHHHGQHHKAGIKSRNNTQSVQFFNCYLKQARLGLLRNINIKLVRLRDWDLLDLCNFEMFLTFSGNISGECPALRRTEQQSGISFTIRRFCSQIFFSSCYI